MKIGDIDLETFQRWSNYTSVERLNNPVEFKKNGGNTSGSRHRNKIINLNKRVEKVKLRN